MKIFYILLSISVLTFSCKKEDPVQKLVNDSFDVIKDQAVNMALYLSDKEGSLPKSWIEEKDEIITSSSKWWCSGFFPGVLWYLYEYTGENSYRELAEKFTARVEDQKYNSQNHDIGFQINCSFGNGYRLTLRPEYNEVMKVAGRTALVRYNPALGVIRSWNSNPQKWQYPVIIDNMMNLELLMWNFHNTNDSIFYKVAVSHSDKTLENHFRSDNSTYHVVSYDTITGLPHIKQTHQGAFDESIWSRGNAWGLYGYVMMYRETRLQRYLDKAIAIANLMIDHVNMPTDGIPYWDYLAPEIPETPRDVSAAAIMASALIELSTFTEGTVSEKFLSFAEKQIKTLASPDYLAKPGTNGFFILKHCVGNMPGNSEVDVPLSYADYYFTEALLRYKKLKGW